MRAKILECGRARVYNLYATVLVRFVLQRQEAFLPAAITCRLMLFRGLDLEEDGIVKRGKKKRGTKHIQTGRWLQVDRQKVWKLSACL